MTTETNMPLDAPTVGDFAYQDFYRAMIERERLQVSREEAAWSERPGRPDRPVEVLLNFGCNVRQTPHLQREAVAVFDVLGVDFAAVAGQHFCCGKPYSGNGLPDVAKRVVEGSVKRMASYQPKQAIQWCSACEMQFRDLVVPEVGIDFQSDGLAAFLVERIDSLGDAVRWTTGVRIKAIVHGHLGEHPVRDGHPAVAMQLLQRIPGVELVGLADTPALDVCDNHGVRVATIGTGEYLAAQAEFEGYLAESGADTLITLYHGCTRELGKFASERLSIRHYISVLAEALGVSKPDRFSEYWRLGDPQKVVDASRPNWESWGISEDEALRLAHKYFVPSYAVNAPECPCNGECTRTGAAWLSPHPIEPTPGLPIIDPDDLS
ncbi:MAG: heterodisulfide reductase-related iron-sulfur binding cluster [Acidimicrobiales bacterium]